MCEFCTQHGEGKKWYENMKNYTAEVFHKVTPERKARKFLNGLYRSMQVDVPRAWQWKKRMPRIYSLLAYPLITRHLKKTHFGQIVPIEDIRRILTTVGSIVRLPCVCRKSTMRKEKRYCLGIGMDMTPLYQDLPDFRGSERLSAGEAVAFVTGLDQEGMMHSVWTLGTPFIGGLCNCDPSINSNTAILPLGAVECKGLPACPDTRCPCGSSRYCMRCPAAVLFPPPFLSFPPYSGGARLCPTGLVRP